MKAFVLLNRRIKLLNFEKKFSSRQCHFQMLPELIFCIQTDQIITNVQIISFTMLQNMDHSHLVDGSLDQSVSSLDQSSSSLDQSALSMDTSAMTADYSRDYIELEGIFTFHNLF